MIIKKHRINLNDPEFAEQIAKEAIHQMQTGGGTLQDVLGVSDELLEEIYALAYNFYDQGKYKESVSLFEFLTGAAPNKYKYVLGLASSYHQLQNYSNAVLGFFIALHLDPENPLPAYYVADCFLKQKMLKEAIEFLDVTIELCEDNVAYNELKERCILIKNSTKSE